MQVATILSSVILGAAAVVVLYYIVLFISQNKFSAAITALIFALGTLHWKYSSGYYRQPITIFFLLLACYLLFLIFNRTNVNKLWLLLSGLCIGSVIFVDSTLVIACIALTIFFITTIKKLQDKKKKIFLFILGLLIPVSINGLYNYKAFNNAFINPYFYEVNEKFAWLKNPPLAFATPLIPSLYVNLFNYKPIPQTVIAPFVWNNLQLRNDLSAYWATVYPYKGIFIQTPTLFLSCIGLTLLFKKYTKEITLLLIIVLGIIIPQAKYTMFYSANMYDTRFFLPAVPFLLIGFSKWWQLISHQRKKYFKYVGYIVTITLISISILNGWYANLTNYAPNVTGEHRFSFEQLHQLFFAGNNFGDNLWLLFINTFPNIYNIHLLFLFYFPLCFIIYLLIFQRKYIKSIFLKYKK